MARSSCRLLLISVACNLLVLPSFTSGKRDDLKDYQVDSLGVSQTLWCNESVQYYDAPNDTEPVSWMLPNLTVLYASSGRFNISENYWSLRVDQVTREDLGQYHCMLRVRYNETEYSDWYLARLGLNAQGPYFEDLWEKYEINTIIGISAGFGFLAMAIGTLLVWHFRYVSPADDGDDKQTNGSPPYVAYEADSKAGEPTTSTFTNNAYDGSCEPIDADEKKRATSDVTASSNTASEPPSDDQSTHDNSGPTDDEGTAF